MQAPGNTLHVRLISLLVGSLNMSRSNTMSKLQKSNREAKKQALLTPREKKAAKQAKKHARDIASLIVKPS